MLLSLRAPPLSLQPIPEDTEHCPCTREHKEEEQSKRVPQLLNPVSWLCCAQCPHSLSSNFAFLTLVFKQIVLLLAGVQRIQRYV